MRRDQFHLDELRQQHLLEKRQLPNKLKAECKQMVAELREGGRQKRVEDLKEDLKRVRQLSATLHSVPHFSTPALHLLPIYILSFRLFVSVRECLVA